MGRTDESVLENFRAELFHKKKPEVDALYTSPMKRCIESCECLYPNMDYEVVKDFREIDFGEFEYKTAKELGSLESYQQWIDSGGTLPFPKGEGRCKFQIRCTKAFVEILKEAESRKLERIAFVIHGGSIMSILDAFSSPHRDYFDWQIANGSGYRGRIEKEKGHHGEGMVIGALHRIWN